MVDIQKNKERMVDLVLSIKRPGVNLPKLIQYLESSDFYTAPASTKFHQSFVGGLCAHSLEVYDNLVALKETFGFNADEDTLKIVALFHDISKINFYEIREKNVKNEAGQWVTEKYYATRDDNDVFVCSSHEVNSAFITQRFIPLTAEEIACIANHHGGIGWDSAKNDLSKVYNKYKLAMYLNQADMISAYDGNDSKTNTEN